MSAEREISMCVFCGRSITRTVLTTGEAGAWRHEHSMRTECHPSTAATPVGAEPGGSGA